MGRWYKKLHNYNITKYDCNIYKDETSCNGDKYCGWKLTDSHHKTYACLEKEYSSIVIGDEEQSTIRTENCSGYTEPIFNQTIEYSLVRAIFHLKIKIICYGIYGNKESVVHCKN